MATQMAMAVAAIVVASAWTVAVRPVRRRGEGNQATWQGRAAPAGRPPVVSDSENDMGRRRVYPEMDEFFDETDGEEVQQGRERAAA